jgi:hypothetical protein
VNCRSLAFPDFLSRVAASVSFVWFSLERTTSVVAGESREAGNPGTLGMTKRREWLRGEDRRQGSGRWDADRQPLLREIKESQPLRMTGFAGGLKYSSLEIGRAL